MANYEQELKDFLDEIKSGEFTVTHYGKVGPYTNRELIFLDMVESIFDDIADTAFDALQELGIDDNEIGLMDDIEELYSDKIYEAAEIAAKKKNVVKMERKK